MRNCIWIQQFNLNFIFKQAKSEIIWTFELESPFSKERLLIPGIPQFNMNFISKHAKSAKNCLQFIVTE